MPTSSAQRRADRTARARADYDDHVAAALDVLALLDLAWHDCYGEPSPPDRVLDDVWTAAGGDLAALASAAYLADVDQRDLRLRVDGGP